MYYDDRNATVAGLPFRVRYPIAERPLNDAAGADYTAGTLVKGAYPWISHDGAELFYMASRVNANNSGARRSGAAELGSFEALQFAPLNRVDEYRAGNRSVLTASEARGLQLFEGKARCSGCHAGQNYTDESFRNNGLTVNADIGRADQTGRNRDFRLQRVPTLRELESTGPYMHDGSIDTLLEVVTSYNAGGLGDPMADTDIRPLELTDQEILDLEAFLRALSAN
jgi:cytochrome c peroxidase